MAEEENGSETPELISFEIMIMIAMLLIAIIGGHYMHKKGSKYIQEAALTTVIGMVGAGILVISGNNAHLQNLQNGFVDIFMVVLLPPIIYESGYNLQKKHFFINFGSVLLYAFLGTFLAAIVTSLILYFCGLWGWTYRMEIEEIATYGSLISATDPVSVLAIFRAMGADKTLYNLVFGESVFNDAVTIVMYQTIQMAIHLSGSTTEILFLSAASFIMIFLGSFLIGAIMALLTAYLLKKQDVPDQKGFKTFEIVIMIFSPWASYLIAQGLELSGIVSILFNGIFLSQYATQNVANDSRRVLKLAYETAAYASETVVFIFLGMGVFAFNHPYGKMGWSLGIGNIIILHIARAVNILICTFLANRGRKRNPISKIFMFVMWMSGLRGAIAYALAIMASQDFQINGDLILLLTIQFALFTIFIVASFLNPLLNWADVLDKPEAQNIAIQGEKDTGCCEELKMSVALFDVNHLAPSLIREGMFRKSKLYTYHAMENMKGNDSEITPLIQGEKVPPSYKPPTEEVKEIELADRSLKQGSSETEEIKSDNRPISNIEGVAPIKESNTSGQEGSDYNVESDKIKKLYEGESED